MSELAERFLHTRIARSVETIRRSFVDNPLDSDPFLVCADFREYMDCQARVGLAYRDQERWSRMSILNVARCGRFSSDRAIREYNEDIWNVTRLPVETSGA